MVAEKLDLTGENAVEIGANYGISIKLCGSPDLDQFLGICQVKSGVGSIEIVLTPSIVILSKDTFQIVLNWSVYPTNLVPGTYDYDVLFVNSTYRFYAVQGKIQVIKRISTAPTS